MRKHVVTAAAYCPLMNSLGNMLTLWTIKQRWWNLQWQNESTLELPPVSALPIVWGSKFMSWHVWDQTNEFKPKSQSSVFWCFGRQLSRNQSLSQIGGISTCSCKPYFVVMVTNSDIMLELARSLRPVILSFQKPLSYHFYLEKILPCVQGKPVDNSNELSLASHTKNVLL